MFERTRSHRDRLVADLDEAINELRAAVRGLGETQGIYGERIIPVLEDKVRDFQRVKDDLLRLL